MGQAFRLPGAGGAKLAHPTRANLLDDAVVAEGATRQILH